MCEELISGLVKKTTGGYKIKYSPKPGMPEVEIDFTPPFKRISMMEGIEEKIGKKLPALDDPEVDAKLLEILAEYDLECTPPHTTARLLDTLVGEFLEDNIIHPTFITEHPQIMSPLAKYHRSKPFLTERFELFAAGREVCFFWSLLLLSCFIFPTVSFRYIYILGILTPFVSLLVGKRVHGIEQSCCSASTIFGASKGRKRRR